MSNNIKIMAEFMGTKKRCYSCISPRRNMVICVDCHGLGYVAPDYPNDTNAMLEVVDKLEASGIYVEIETVGVRMISIFRPNMSIFEGGYKLGTWADLPRVLFPLLVSAIKEVK